MVEVLPVAEAVRPVATVDVEAAEAVEAVEAEPAEADAEEAEEAEPAEDEAELALMDIEPATDAELDVIERDIGRPSPATSTNALARRGPMGQDMAGGGGDPLLARGGGRPGGR